MRNHYQFLNDLLLLTLLLSVSTRAQPLGCPEDFNLTYNSFDKNYVCYRLKNAEIYSDKYRHCNGNFYNLETFHRLNIDTNIERKLWIEYSTLYPGGPFIESKYSKDKPNIIFNITNIQHVDDSTDLCLITHKNGYKAVKCTDHYQRYCFVKPIDTKNVENCDDHYESAKFYSPEPMCLIKIIKKDGITWNEAKDLCENKAHRLLSRAWFYINSDFFNSSNLYPVDKMNFEKTYSRMHYVAVNSKWQEWGVMKDAELGRVEKTYKYTEIICEKDIINDIILELGINDKNELILDINYNSNESYIHCFTDSETYYPTYVKINRIKDDFDYLLTPTGDGYYWCVHVHTNTRPIFSNRILFVNSGANLWYMYAIKIRVNEYDIEAVDRLKNYWKEKLDEYILHVYMSNEKDDKQNIEMELSDENRNLRNEIDNKELVHNVFDLTESEKSDNNITHGLKPIDENQDLKNVTNEEKREKYDLNMTKSDISDNSDENEDFHAITYTKVKRLYLDKRTVLLHVKLVEDFIIRTPVVLGDLELLDLRPVLYCKGRRLYYKCDGDFNIGRYWQPILSKRELNIEENEGFMRVNLTNMTGRSLTNEMCLESNCQEYITYPYTMDDIYTTNNPNEIATTDRTTTANETTTTYISTDYSYNTTTECTETTTDPDETTILPTLSTITTTTPMPKELIQEILDDLDLVLQDDSVPIMIGDIRDTFAQVNNLLDMVDEEMYIPERLLQLLDEVASRVNLDGQPTAMVVETNVAMLMADSTPTYPVLGISVGASDTDQFNYESFDFIRQSRDQLSFNKTEAAVVLPPSIGAIGRRVSFVVFRDGRAFNPTGMVSVNSRVISVSAENITSFGHGEFVSIHTSPLLTDPGRNTSRVCGYWRFVPNQPGYWTQDGCVFIRSRDQQTLDICQCNHLTHFAEILIPRAHFSERTENILEAISVTGCLMSILGLLVVILTSVLIESWRKIFRNQMWLQMCIAIFVMMICYIVVVFADFTYNTGSCMFVGILLHYSLLASFCWMLAVATKCYRDLVPIFVPPMRRKLLIASVFSWGSPAIVIILLISIFPWSYSNRFSEMNPNSNFCYPSGLALWLTVYLPICLILFVNCTLFVLIIRSIGIVPKNLRYQRAGDKREALHCARVGIVLAFFFGLPWLFGLFAHNIVAAYFFTLTATTQGFVLFVFIVLGNRDTRNMWLSKLRSKGFINNTTSSRSITMLN
ncbi:uncharacterized protein LOC128683753 [Plodia interpunctella]|uniref:uncharacterized protein LOC128683753 n=1 Tax=Plodia interpunctella TaxID=58824 RepID=UPI002367C697|nr:uncharacterized protein LOC128683753 [Plodia interpunctella]XP_053625646.1 uncharacterized protein LOC128683753 [Plodia interpunctella]XP_053625648.1 uncharacterized protein LOC128683753 [Plodia interpunctella]